MKLIIDGRAYFGANYNSHMIRTALFALLAVFTACQPQKPTESPAVWKKIRIDFKQLDEQGLLGTGKGKVAMNYEFCIPAQEKLWRQVRKTDPTAQRNEGKGRVGCKENQWLVIGATNQKNYQRVLFNLASMPFVERIEPVFWE